MEEVVVKLLIYVLRVQQCPLSLTYCFILAIYSFVSQRNFTSIRDNKFLTGKLLPRWLSQLDTVSLTKGLHRRKTCVRWVALRRLDEMILLMFGK